MEDFILWLKYLLLGIVQGVTSRFRYPPAVI